VEIFEYPTKMKIIELTNELIEVENTINSRWLQDFTKNVTKEVGIVGHYSNHSWRAFQLTGLHEACYSKSSIIAESPGSSSVDSYLTEADSQLADKTRDLFAAVAQGTSCYDYKKTHRESGN